MGKEDGKVSEGSGEKIMFRDEMPCKVNGRSRNKDASSTDV